MSDNGRSKPSPIHSQKPCASCGLPADLDSDHVIVEFKARRSFQDAIARVWHRGCYDEFLDQGEES
jgi:hypothetical protein